MTESLNDMVLNAATDLLRVIDEQERLAPLSAQQALAVQAAQEVVSYAKAERES